jgi:hypothetical protein
VERFAAFDQNATNRPSPLSEPVPSVRPVSCFPEEVTDAISVTDPLTASAEAAGTHAAMASTAVIFKHDAGRIDNLDAVTLS